MAFFQFACPYCSGQFQVENRPSGQAVACPNCGGQVALPADVSPPDDEPPRAAADPSAADQQVATGDPLVFLDVTPAPAAGSRRQPRRAPRGDVRRLSREEKERRRARRNLVLMAAGILVLSVAAVVLSRF